MFFTAAGHRLEASWHGPPPEAAPTLVLLHEGLGSVSAWRRWPEELSLATGLGVLAYSRWGYGQSDPVTPPRPLSYMEDEARESLGEVLTQAKVERAILLGHSDGASIALTYAGTHDDPRVEGVVCLAPHVFCEALGVRSIEKAREEFLHGELRKKLQRHHADVEGAFWGWNRAWLDPRFRDWNIERALPGIFVPVLVIQGETDPYGTLAQVDAIARGVRGPFERRILADCGHSPQRDQPLATTGAVAGFAQRVC